MVQTANMPLGLILSPQIRLYVSLADFAELAQLNRELLLERSAIGELIVNPLTGWESSQRNSTLNGLLFAWWREAGQPGHLFESSGGFILLNGAVRSPDASWVSDARWATRDPDPSTAFATVCPDFVVELRSASDRLSPLQEKMVEYRENGVQLGWLLDPQNRRVEIYRAGGEVDRLESPETLSGEAVLPGFCLPLSWIWSVP